MHGHGAKPHLCSYKDCERAIPGNGFPRRYNLFDHMKRVHDYKVPPSPPLPPADGTHRRTKPKAQNSRKRKSSAPSADELHVPAKRTKLEAVSKSAEAPVHESVALSPQQSRRWSERNQLEAMWNMHHGGLFTHVQLLDGPKDSLGLQNIKNDLANLDQIAEQWKGFG